MAPKAQNPSSKGSILVGSVKMGVGANKMAAMKRLNPKSETVALVRYFDVKIIYPEKY